MSENTTPMHQNTDQPQQDLPDNMTCEQLWSLESQGELPTILDVREPHEWEDGHIEYATHLPLSQIPSEAEGILPNKSDLIVTCCSLGGRSAIAAQQLKEMGYTNVKNLSGGFTGYCNRELEEPELDDEAEAQDDMGGEE